MDGRCGVCAASLLEGRLVGCPSCRAAYHADCWDYNRRRCAVYGCSAGPPREPALPGPAVPWRREVAAILVALTVIATLVLTSSSLGLAPVDDWALHGGSESQACSRIGLKPDREFVLEEYRVVRGNDRRGDEVWLYLPKDDADGRVVGVARRHRGRWRTTGAVVSHHHRR